MQDISNPSMNFFASLIDGESVPGHGISPERCENASNMLSEPNFLSSLVATVSYPNSPSNCISPRNTRLEFDNPKQQTPTEVTCYLSFNNREYANVEFGTKENKSKY